MQSNDRGIWPDLQCDELEALNEVGIRGEEALTSARRLSPPTSNTTLDPQNGRQKLTFEPQQLTCQDPVAPLLRSRPARSTLRPTGRPRAETGAPQCARQL